MNNSAVILAMRPKVNEIWNLCRLPARLNCIEAGALLGFSEDDIRHLATKKLLPLLGGANPGTFWFAAVEIDGFSRDINWLARATKAVREHNRAKNERLSQKLSGKKSVL